MLNLLLCYINFCCEPLQTQNAVQFVMFFKSVSCVVTDEVLNQAGQLSGLATASPPPQQEPLSNSPQETHHGNRPATDPALPYHTIPYTAEPQR